MSEIKKINIVFEDTAENKYEKENNQPKKRIITTTDKWKNIETDITFEKQKSYIRELYKEKVISKEVCSIILQQIKQKISGYRNQDVLKKLLETDKFVDIKKVLELLEKSELLCYYCRKEVKLLYENVREMTQWSLDRLDNSEGHNKENVVIACLSCNLHRKTMYHERFVFTKQLNIVKKM
tara:strand:- start:788 stop:1330 length:543 start_codon:yes stop_codon:yes gene_type:complete